MTRCASSVIVAADSWDGVTLQSDATFRLGRKNRLIIALHLRLAICVNSLWLVATLIATLLPRPWAA